MIRKKINHNLKLERKKLKRQKKRYMSSKKKYPPPKMKTSLQKDLKKIEGTKLNGRKVTDMRINMKEKEINTKKEETDTKRKEIIMTESHDMRKMNIMNEKLCMKKRKNLKISPKITAIPLLSQPHKRWDHKSPNTSRKNEIDDEINIEWGGIYYPFKVFFLKMWVYMLLTIFFKTIRIYKHY